MSLCGLFVDSVKYNFMKSLRRMIDAYSFDRQRNLPRVFTGNRLSISILRSIGRRSEILLRSSEIFFICLFDDAGVVSTIASLVSTLSFSSFALSLFMRIGKNKENPKLKTLLCTEKRFYERLRFVQQAGVLQRFRITRSRLNLNFYIFVFFVISN